MISFFKSHQDKFLFIISGGIQYFIDVLFFALMVMLLGNNININIASRFFAGFIGFYLNGYVVFGTFKGKRMDQLLWPFIKFLLLLCAMTFLSSFFLTFFSHLSEGNFILAKGVVEIFLAAISFLLQKYVIYRFNR